MRYCNRRDMKRFGLVSEKKLEINWIENEIHINVGLIQGFVKIIQGTQVFVCPKLNYLNVLSDNCKCDFSSLGSKDKITQVITIKSSYHKVLNRHVIFAYVE